MAVWLRQVWNTGPLTRYFNSGMHLYEVNPDNPLGTRGALALRYGELCKEVGVQLVCSLLYNSIIFITRDL